MAELTKLEAKLGEVAGLAMAAQAATKKVSTLAKEEHPDLVPRLERMHEEAAETERRCTELADDLDGKKTAILEEARATKSKGAEMMSHVPRRRCRRARRLRVPHDGRSRRGRPLVGAEEAEREERLRRDPRPRGVGAARFRRAT